MKTHEEKMYETDERKKNTNYNILPTTINKPENNAKYKKEYKKSNISKYYWRMK